MTIDKKQADAIASIIDECENRLGNVIGNAVSIRIITPHVVFDDKNHKALHIKKAVADAFDITVDDIESTRRKAPAPEARFMAMKIMNEKKFRHKDIMKSFEGIKNHTSITYGIKKFEELYQTEQSYQFKYAAVMGNINGI